MKKNYAFRRLEHKPYGFNANKEVAKAGESIAKIAREDLEERFGETIIRKNYALNYQYIDDKKELIE